MALVLTCRCFGVSFSWFVPEKLQPYFFVFFSAEKNPEGVEPCSFCKPVRGGLAFRAGASMDHGIEIIRPVRTGGSAVAMADLGVRRQDCAGPVDPVLGTVPDDHSVRAKPDLKVVEYGGESTYGAPAHPF